ncbi:MAG: hypothetical protein Q9208_005648 [Pyrenodesmia sp. 3 TL-2023]
MARVPSEPPIALRSGLRVVNEHGELKLEDEENMKRSRLAVVFQDPEDPDAQYKVQSMEENFIGAVASAEGAKRKVGETASLLACWK